MPRKRLKEALMGMRMPRGKTPEQLRAWLDLRQGSRTQRHVDRHAEARAGRGKGGRRAWRRETEGDLG